MTEVCNRGHEQTDENISWHKRGDRPGYRKRCLPCKRESYNSNGQPTVYMKSGQLTTEHHEDIEDLLRFGATYKEILDRGPFASWDTMRRSLKRRGREDLIEKLVEKKGRVGINTPLITRNEQDKKKQGRRQFRHGDVHELPKELEELIFEPYPWN